MRSRSSNPGLVVLLLCAACAGSPPPPAPYAPRPVVEVARWHVFAGDRLLGRVVQLEIHDPAGPLPFYRIEDPHGRWLGHASMQGRFTRRVPFADGEQDLGVWPMARGVARLFEATGTVELRPVAVDAVARPGQAAPR